MKLFRLSIREIRKKKLFSGLTFLVCVIAMQTVLSAVTNAASAACQQKILESSMGVDWGKVLHLDYQYTEENPEFAKVLRQFLDDIRGLPGVEAVGRFDATGVYFSELKDLEEYKAVNAAWSKGKKYENYPGISRLLSVDEEILSFVKGGITEYAATTHALPPLYVSEVFRGVLSTGQILTDERTGDQYEIAGYIPAGAQWVEEDDLIRFPLVSLDGWFVAPFTEQSRNDIMTQLSCLHNTYVLLADGADAGRIQEQISACSRQQDFQASAVLLSEEYNAYRDETAAFTARQLVLALFIAGMAVSSVVAVFTTNTVLNKKQYGIWLANGFTVSNIAAEIAVEIGCLVFCSGILAWTVKWVELTQSTDLFQTVLKLAHIRYTLPLCILLALVLTGLAAFIPIVKLRTCRPCEWMEGDPNGDD